MEISEKTMKIILSMQKGEFTEYYIYRNIAHGVKDENNKKTLIEISNEEFGHSELWKTYTRQIVKADKLRLFWYTLIAKLFGYTFAIKLMERGEDSASSIYAEIAREIPQAMQISDDEQRHEQLLIGMLDEERLQYVGSMVLGLNDALVELTGTLAGLTFALQNTKLVALSGLITGISATLSMASSEYLSAKNEGSPNALKSCIYTGIAYCITVALLVMPYLIFPSELFGTALGCMLVMVVLIITVFTYYISVAKDIPFFSRFREMAFISIGVALVSFLIGLLVKRFLGIDV